MKKKVYMPPQVRCHHLFAADALLDFSEDVNPGEDGNQEEAESNMWQGAFEESTGQRYSIWDE